MFGMGNDTIHYSIFNFQVGNGNPNSLSYAKPAKPKAWTPRREENSWFNHGWTRCLPVAEMDTEFWVPGHRFQRSTFLTCDGHVV